MGDSKLSAGQKLSAVSLHECTQNVNGHGGIVVVVVMGVEVVMVVPLTFCVHSCSDTADNFWPADNFGLSIYIIYINILPTKRYGL